MKIATDIKPRVEGHVEVETHSSNYEFKPDHEGRLVAEVEDDSDIAFLLNTGNFYPANEGDIETGIAVVKSETETEGAEDAADPVDGEQKEGGAEDSAPVAEGNDVAPAAEAEKTEAQPAAKKPGGKKSGGK